MNSRPKQELENIGDEKEDKKERGRPGNLEQVRFYPDDILAFLGSPPRSLDLPKC